MSYPLGNGGVNTQASWGLGFARNRSEAMYPELWDGLIGAWFPLLGATGLTLHDVSGKGNNGTLNNMDPSAAWITRPKGPVLDFGGSDDYIAATIPTINPPFTMAACFQTDNAADNHTLISIAGGDEGATYYHSLRTAGTSLVARTFAGSTADASISSAISSTAVTDTIYCAVGVWTAHNSRSVYLVNTGQSATNTQTQTLSNSDVLAIGRTADSTPIEYWNGVIGSSSIWDRALSLSEIEIFASRQDAIIARPNDLAMQIASMRGFVTPSTGIVVLRRRRECA